MLFYSVTAILLLRPIQKLYLQRRLWLVIFIRKLSLYTLSVIKVSLSEVFNWGNVSRTKENIFYFQCSVYRSIWGKSLSKGEKQFFLYVPLSEKKVSLCEGKVPPSEEITFLFSHLKKRFFLHALLSEYKVSLSKNFVFTCMYSWGKVLIFRRKGLSIWQKDFSVFSI